MKLFPEFLLNEKVERNIQKGYKSKNNSICDICRVVFSSEVLQGPSNDYGSVCYDCITEGFIIKGFGPKPGPKPKRCWYWPPSWFC